MRKFFARLGMFVAALYLVLHIILASSPVQKRVFSEVSQALAQFGLTLEIESIEFSAFAPRIYLNRVTLGTTSKAVVQLDEPLAVDKIKIEFQPIALISRKVIIDEMTLFHPKIIVPKADALYQRIKKILGEQSKIVAQGGKFQVVFKKIGIVDALFNVVSENPSFSIRSRSLSAFLEQSASNQETLNVESRNIEFERGPLKLNLTKTDIDVDVSPKSIRVNRGTLEGEKVSIHLKGATNIPEKSGKLPDSLHFNYDFSVDSSYLTNIPELGLPKMDGLVLSSGNFQLDRGNYSGTGTTGFKDLQIDGYHLGKSSVDYALNEKSVKLSNLEWHVGEGVVTSSSTVVELKETFPVTGEIGLKGLNLEGVLKNLKAENAPVKMRVDGKAEFSGTLQKPLKLNAHLLSHFTDFYVLNDVNKPIDNENKILSIKEGSIDARLDFDEEHMTFKSKLNVIDGTIMADGNIGYDNTADIRANGQGLSLTRLKTIGDIPFGGKVNLLANINIANGRAAISGGFDVNQAEIADIMLGNVKGSAFFDNMLLSFENLELTSLEPIRARGFVDFHPKRNHYKFNINTRRAAVDQIFQMFDKVKLGFPKPKGGETGARVTLEGGLDNEGIDVQALGQARNFTWYGEKWINGQFSFRFRPEYADLERAVLVKRSGGLEARGHFQGKKSKLTLISHGLRVEELDSLGKAPIQGEIVGQLRLMNDLYHPEGEGEVSLTKAFFRGTKIPDSSIRVHTENEKTEFLATVLGEKLKGKWLRYQKAGNEASELSFNFKDYDFSPLLTLWLGKDIPPLTSLVATGDVGVKGNFDSWQKVSGSATLSKLDVQFRSTPLRNEGPIHIRVQNGSVSVERFKLSGPDSQLAIDYSYEPKKLIQANIDGKLDLQFIQPFLPGLEYGTGRVSAGIRVSGVPEKYDLLGNISLEDGTFRIKSIQDEFRSAQAQLTLSQDKLNVDHFQAALGGGSVAVSGDIKINKFQSLIPQLAISANRVGMKTQPNLFTRVSGEFYIKGNDTPYLFGGKCYILDAKLSDFNLKEAIKTADAAPAFNFDVRCEAKDKLFVDTEVMNAEFKGSLKLTGDTENIGLLGTLDAVQGQVIFKETKFKLESGTVKFEELRRIAPRFNVSGRATVREQRTNVPQDYDVTLNVFGIPSDYKIRLTSSPALAEADLISLLVLGVTTRSQDGNYLDFGTTIVGQTPLQSKIQSELGVDIKVSAQSPSTGPGSNLGSTSSGTTSGDLAVPSVKIQKEVTKKTKVSVSNTIETVPLKEFKIEHMLNDNFTVNGTRTEKNRGGVTQEGANPSAAYGVDFRYRFSFE